MDAGKRARAFPTGALVVASLALAIALAAGFLALIRSQPPGRPAVVPVRAALAELHAEQAAAANRAAPTAMVATISPSAPQPAQHRMPRVVRPTPAADPCAVLRDRDEHLGETVTFRGEYHADREGRVLVRPLGCEQAIVLSDVSPAARRALDQADGGRLVGDFTATLVGALPEGLASSDDSAVRLSITAVADLQKVDPQPNRPPQ